MGGSKGNPVARTAMTVMLDALAQCSRKPSAALMMLSHQISIIAHRITTLLTACCH